MVVAQTRQPRENGAIFLIYYFLFSLVPLCRLSYSMRRREHNSVFLCRTIGNNLPPRHSPDQSMVNLRFILENETKVKSSILQKHWILNRIVNETVLSELLQILKEYDQAYTIIPFNLSFYAQLKENFHLNRLQRDILHNTHVLTDFDEKKWVIDEVLREKNLYVMNNNAARNVMIDLGKKSKKRWILPWDGNCFLTRSAWRQIFTTLRHKGRTNKYFIVPMLRVDYNEQVFSQDLLKHPKEEPQLIFRFDAEATFNASYMYGRRPKVELLMRLGVPGVWDSWKWTTWEDAPVKRSVSDMIMYPGREIPTAGWIARLSSGLKQLKDSIAMNSLIERGNSRSYSIKLLLNNLDLQVAMSKQLFTSASLFYYNEAQLEKEKSWYNAVKFNSSSGSAQSNRFYQLIYNLIEDGDAAMIVGPWSVVRSKELIRSMQIASLSYDQHCYYSTSPTYHSPPHSSCSRFFERERFSTNKLRTSNISLGEMLSREVSGTFMPCSSQQLPCTQEPTNINDDYTSFISMARNTTILALSWYFTDQMKYAKKAAHNIKIWFLDRETFMAPHLKGAQKLTVQSNQTRTAAIEANNDRGIIEFKDIYYFLDAIRLIQRSNALSKTDYQNLQQWFTRYLSWLEQQKKVASYPDYQGLYYDIQIASIAAFVGDLGKYVQTVRLSISRLGSHFHDTGHIILHNLTIADSCRIWERIASSSGKDEDEGEEYRKRNDYLQQAMWLYHGWTTMARIAQKAGVAIWEWEFDSKYKTAVAEKQQPPPPTKPERTTTILCDGVKLLRQQHYKQLQSCKVDGRSALVHTITSQLSDCFSVGSWWPVWNSAQKYCPYDTIRETEGQGKNYAQTGDAPTASPSINSSRCGNSSVSSGDDNVLKTTSNNNNNNSNNKKSVLLSQSFNGSGTSSSTTIRTSSSAATLYDVTFLSYSHDYFIAPYWNLGMGLF